MLKFILRKMLYGFLVLWGVVTLIFFLFHSDPTSAARNIAGERANADMIKEIEHKYHLDLPIHKQYLLFLNNLSPISIHNEVEEESPIYLDQKEYSASTLFSYSDNRTVVFKYPYLNRSYKNQKKVSETLLDKLPSTFILAVVAISFGLVFGLILGVFSAIYKGTFIDSSALVLAVLGMSAPSFVMAVFVSWIGGVLWFEEASLPLLPFLSLGLGIIIGLISHKISSKHILKSISAGSIGLMAFKGFVIGTLFWFIGFGIEGLFGDGVLGLINQYISLPGTGLDSNGTLYSVGDFGEEVTDWNTLILPAFTLGIRPLAIIMQLTRSSMLDVLNQDFVRTAKAKGLSYKRTIVKHVLKNALNPVITAVSGWFGSLLAGSVFIEIIFNWDGLGKVILKGIVEKDVPLIIGICVCIACFFVIINIIVDIIYGLIDPRVRVK